MKVKGYSKSVTWKSSAKSVASVNKSGKVTGKRAGTAVITAKAGKKSLRCVINVKAKQLSSQQVSENLMKQQMKDETKQKDLYAFAMDDEISIRKGESSFIPISLKDCTVTWKSSNTGIVNVQNNGRISGVKEGTATVYASVNGYRTNACTVHVVDCSNVAIYKKIMSMQKKYPQGMRFTNYTPYSPQKPYYSNFRYRYRNVILGAWSGCAAFAAILSDTAFSTLPIKSLYTNPANVEIGDIIRVNNDTHSEIVLKKTTYRIYTAAANVGGKVTWTRSYSKAEFRNRFTYGITRY